jgi:hypothetical protein
MEVRIRTVDAEPDVRGAARQRTTTAGDAAWKFGLKAGAHDATAVTARRDGC